MSFDFTLGPVTMPDREEARKVLMGSAVSCTGIINPNSSVESDSKSGIYSV
jgi:hypothetical protein